jgi:hypothetical protein
MGVEGVVERGHGHDVADVPLVVLEDQGHVFEAEAQLGQVLLQVAERLDVGVEGRGLAIGDEDDPIHPLEHELAGGVVEDLAGDGVELQPDLHAADDPHVERQQVEEQGAVGLGLQAHHVAAGLGRGALVDGLQVGGLPAQARAVVHDLGRHLHRRVVEEDHGAASLTRG